MRVNKLSIYLIALLLLFSGCASLRSPDETGIAVSVLLDEIQIAINEIGEQTAGTSLPPFKGAQVKLVTKAGITDGGGASLVLSAEGKKTTMDTNTLTLDLVPNPSATKAAPTGTGQEIAKYVVAAVAAVDQKNFLKLKSLVVETGLEVKKTATGGIDVELVGVSVKGKRTGETTDGHTLTLTFAEK
jgi:hypothetical protein